MVTTVMIIMTNTVAPDDDLTVMIIIEVVMVVVRMNIMQREGRERRQTDRQSGECGEAQ